MIHVFDVNVAKEVGVGAAVILQNIYYWVEKNKANDKHFYDGRYWTYNSVKAFSELFPYFTDKQIRTHLSNLKTHGLILTGNYNKLSFDKTIWYTLSNSAYALLNKGLTDLPI